MQGSHGFGEVDRASLRVQVAPTGTRWDIRRGLESESNRHVAELEREVLHDAPLH